MTKGNCQLCASGDRTERIDAYKERVEIEDPALLIRINQLYTPDMSKVELYDVARGVWVLGERREKAKYACAVAGGTIVEVFTIDEWHPAGSTPYSRRVIDLPRYQGRWEFTGNVAPDGIRSKYIGRSVAHYFSRGAANPVMYVNC